MLEAPSSRRTTCPDKDGERSPSVLPEENSNYVLAMSLPNTLLILPSWMSMSIAFITSFSDQVGRLVFFLNSPFDGIAAAAFMGEVNGCRLMYPNISFSPALR